MSDMEAIIPLQSDHPTLPRKTTHSKQTPPQHSSHHAQQQAIVAFQKHELNIILNVYGHHVAAGNWRDYAIDFGKHKAMFSIFRRASECPLYRIIKDPKLSKKQGIYSIVDQTGRILKRGHDLPQVLKILALKPKLSVV